MTDPIKDYDVDAQIKRAYESAWGYVLRHPQLRELILETGGEYSSRHHIHLGPYHSSVMTITIKRKDILDILASLRGGQPQDPPKPGV